MNSRRPIPFPVIGGVLCPISLFALLVFNPLLALPICAVALIVFSAITSGIKSHRHDKISELQAKAAQRGD